MSLSPHRIVKRKTVFLYNDRSVTTATWMLHGSYNIRFTVATCYEYFLIARNDVFKNKKIRRCISVSISIDEIYEIYCINYGQ